MVYIKEKRPNRFVENLVGKFQPNKSSFDLLGLEWYNKQDLTGLAFENLRHHPGRSIQ